MRSSIGSPFDLLRRHVLQGANHLAGIGQWLFARRRWERVKRISLERLRHAKVEQLGASLGQHDVGGLEIAMHDPVPVRMVERLGNLDRMTQDLIGRKRTAVQSPRDRLALDEFHHEVFAAILNADVIQRADVRMIQTGNGFCLGLKPLLGHAALGAADVKQLDRHLAIEASVSGEMHLAHAAGPQRRDDFVRTEASTGDE